MTSSNSNFIISIIGLGVVMGGLASSASLSLGALVVIGVGLGLMLGGVFRAIQANCSDSK